MSGGHNLEELWKQGRASAVYDDDVYDWPDVSTTGLSTDAGALAFQEPHFVRLIVPVVDGADD